MALDVVTNWRRLDDLVRGPSAYLARKDDNSKGNGKKAAILKDHDQERSKKGKAALAPPNGKIRQTLSPAAGYGDQWFQSGFTSKRPRDDEDVGEERSSKHVAGS